MNTAVRHQNTSCPDGGIEHLHQSLLGANIQIIQHSQPCVLDISRLKLFTDRGNRPFFKIVILLVRYINLHNGLLMRSVGIEEGSLQIDDLLSSPVQHQSRLLGDNSHRYRLKVLLRRIFQEFIHICRGHNNSHTLL